MFCFGNSYGKKRLRARNNYIFNLKVPVIDEVFDGIRRLTGKKNGGSLYFT
jgi:hypothetical protein